VDVPRDVPEDEVDGYFERLSNWGRWGRADELGTLNLITDEKRRQAAALVRLGHPVSCAWDVAATVEQDHVHGTAQRFMLGTGEAAAQADGGRDAAAREFVGMTFHGFHVTHLDALSHMFWDGRMYNDQPSAKVTAQSGATHHDVTNARRGIVTRGVLLDIPALRGADWLDPGEGVHREEVLAAEAAAGVTVESGDAVLLRTGYDRRRRLQGTEDLRANGHPGWHASCLPWLHERDVAVIGCDTAQDALPSAYPGVRAPVHLVGIVKMGLWLIDNCALEELAATCRSLGCWEFLFVATPIPVVGGTGSAVNPLAIF
jgi:kynurenine formamidase